jgi:hypothetical protein
MTLDFLESPVEFSRLLGLVIPLLVALLTTRAAESWLKSIANIILTSLAGVTATLVGLDGEWAWDTFFNAWFNAFVLAGIAHLTAYNKLGIRQKVDDIAPNFGVDALRKTE